MRVVGTEGPSRMGSPMSTVMVPSEFIWGMIGPARVLIRYDSADVGLEYHYFVNELCGIISGRCY